MRRLALALVLLAIPAAAQQPPPSALPYAPITLSEASYKEITTWLMEQPAKFALPMLQWLEAQERAAVVQANKPKDAPKPEPPNKPD